MSKSLDEHRLYKTLGDRFRFLGLTLDEWMIGLGCFFGSLIAFNGSIMGGFGMLGSGFSIYFLKKAKKKFAGTQLKSFLYWQGIWKRPSTSYPPFNHRRYRS